MIVEVPGVGNVEFPDSMTPEQVSAALAQSGGVRTEQNPDGTYGQPPAGFVLNQQTGQMEDVTSPNNPNIPTGRAVSLGVGAGQGLGFGGFDETVAKGLDIVGNRGYDYELARTREMERRAREQNPGYYFSGMFPGAVASSVSAGKLLGINPTGKNMLDTMVRGAGIGAGEGAAYGALTGEGGVGNRAKSAAKGGLIGAGIGAAAPPVIAGAAYAGRRAGDLVGGGVDAVINRANSGRANRAIMDTLRKAGLTVDDVSDDVMRAAREGQPEYRLMDAAGIAGQRKASGVVRSGGDGAEEVAQFLRQRQLDQADRVGGFVDDAFGVKGTTAAKTKEALNAARKATNDVNYSAARQNAGPVNLTPVIDQIDDLMKRNPILGESSLGKSEIGSRLSSLRSSMQNNGEQLIDFDTVLNLKEDLGGVISGLRKSGKEVPPHLARVYGSLDDALAASSDAYRAANDAAFAGRKVVGAVDEGAEMLRPGRRAADTVPAFQGMTPEQQAAARVGYGDRALARIEANASPTANVAKPFNSTKVRTEADAMAIDPGLFGNRVGRENTMWETQNRALGGSRTADNLSDVTDTGMVADIGRAARDAFTGRIGSAIGTVANRVGNAASGQNEATRTLVAKMLMSDNPRQALAQALRQETTSQGRRRIVEAMTRALGREVTQ